MQRDRLRVASDNAPKAPCLGSPGLRRISGVLCAAKSLQQASISVVSVRLAVLTPLVLGSSGAPPLQSWQAAEQPRLVRWLRYIITLPYESNKAAPCVRCNSRHVGFLIWFRVAHVVLHSDYSVTWVCGREQLIAQSRA